MKDHCVGQDRNCGIHADIGTIGIYGQNACFPNLTFSHIG